MNLRETMVVLCEYIIYIGFGYLLRLAYNDQRFRSIQLIFKLNTLDTRKSRRRGSPNDDSIFKCVADIDVEIGNLREN